MVKYPLTFAKQFRANRVQIARVLARIDDVLYDVAAATYRTLSCCRRRIRRVIADQATDNRLHPQSRIERGVLIKMSSNAANSRRAGMLAILSVFVLSLALSGCGGGSDAERVQGEAGGSPAVGAGGKPVYKEDPASTAAGGSGLPVAPPK
jgi:hypothetical protein